MPERIDCPLEKLVIRFEESGFEVMPIDMDLRQDMGQDDWFTATIAEPAARELQMDYIPREPVTVQYDGEQFWRGWIKRGDVTKSDITGSIKLRPPMQILEEGQVHEERMKTSLGDIVDHILSARLDTYGVITGHEFVSESKAQEVRYQHDKSIAREIVDLEALREIQDSLRERLDILPTIEGDGDFDFRGENPRAALAEVCRAFSTRAYVDSDGTLMIGRPDEDPNTYTTGVRRGSPSPWGLIDYSIPDTENPTGRVVISGKQVDTTSDPSTGPAMSEGAIHSRSPSQKKTPMASASFEGYSGPTVHLTAAGTSNAEILESIAGSYLIGTYIDQSHAGSVTVSTVIDGSVAAVGPLKIGDRLIIEQASDCGVEGGAYRINAINHSVESDGKWEIDFDISHLLPGSITTDSWEYSTQDETQNDPTGQTSVEDFLSANATMTALNPGMSLALMVNGWDWTDVAESTVDFSQDTDEFLDNSISQLRETYNEARDEDDDGTGSDEVDDSSLAGS